MSSIPFDVSPFKNEDTQAFGFLDISNKGDQPFDNQQKNGTSSLTQRVSDPQRNENNTQIDTIGGPSLSPILKAKQELFINLNYANGEDCLKTEISEDAISRKTSNKTRMMSNKQGKLYKTNRARSNSNKSTLRASYKGNSEMSYSMKNGDDSFDSSSVAPSLYFGMQDYYHAHNKSFHGLGHRETGLYKQKSNTIRTKVKRSYYQMLSKKLARRNSREINDPEEFEELVYEIDEEIRIPNAEKNRDLKLIKMPQLEQAEKYYDSYPLLGFRKSIMIIQAKIAAIASRIIKSSVFDFIILFVIVANSITLAFADPITNKSPLPAGFDIAYLAIYTIEMCLKIIGMGFLFNEGAYLREAWNVMDFVIVVTAYVPYLFSSSTVNLQAFRALRVLRPLRTISSIEQLRILIITLIGSLKPLLNIIFLLLFLFMIFAIGGLQLFQGLLKKRCFALETGIVITDPSEINEQMFCSSDSDCGMISGVVSICGKMIANPEYGITNFDTVFSSLLMVFQVVTLEGWSNIMVVLQKTFSPFVVVYFIFLIFIGTFFLLNLTLAVIKTEFTVSSINAKAKGSAKENSEESWSNKNLNERIGKHKLDILEIRRKQAVGKFMYHKYQFKKNHMIAVPSSRFAMRVTKHERKQKRQNIFATKLKIIFKIFFEGIRSFIRKMFKRLEVKRSQVINIDSNGMVYWKTL